MKIRSIAFLLSLFAFLSLTSSSVFAQPAFSSANELDAWISHYYQHPDVSKIAGGMVYYPDSTLYSPQTRVPISHFFAALIKANPDLLNPIFDSVGQKGSTEAKLFAINTMWLVNTEASRALLKRAQGEWNLPEPVRPAIDQKLGKPPVWALEAPVKSALSLDILWGIYFATGDPAPIKKIVSVLHLSKDGKGEEMVLGSAAMASLMSEAKDHPKVLEILQAEAKTADEVTQAKLHEIITSSPQKKTG